MGQKANEWGNAIAIRYEGGGGGGLSTALARLFAFSFFCYSRFFVQQRESLLRHFELLRQPPL